MNFYKDLKKSDNADGKKYNVYMSLNGSHYVCEMIDDDTETAKTINELGLTLRARLTRSKGKFAILEGSIFNPERLLESACEISSFTKEDFIGGDYKNGYTLLCITADGCTNKYMIFNKMLLDSLIEKLKRRVKK